MDTLQERIIFLYVEYVEDLEDTNMVLIFDKEFQPQTTQSILYEYDIDIVGLVQNCTYR